MYDERFQALKGMPAKKTFFSGKVLHIRGWGYLNDLGLYPERNFFQGQFLTWRGLIVMTNWNVDLYDKTLWSHGCDQFSCLTFYNLSWLLVTLNIFVCCSAVGFVCHLFENHITSLSWINVIIDWLTFQRVSPPSPWSPRLGAPAYFDFTSTNS